MTLEDKLKEAESTANAGSYELAITQLDTLSGEFPEESLVWSAYAYVYSRAGNYEAAAEAMSAAIKLDSGEPHLFYMRAHYWLRLSEYSRSHDDCTATLKLCDLHETDYYRIPAHFLRAECLIELKQFDRAATECEHIPEAFEMWIRSLRSKRDLLVEIRSGLNSVP